MSDVPTSATMGPLETQGTALYKFEVWANPVTETVEFKFCDALGRKIELEGRGMEGETHHMGSPPAGDPNPNPNSNPSPNPNPNPKPQPQPQTPNPKPKPKPKPKP